MRQLLLASLTLIGGAFATAAWSAPGEYWEVTAKMEMPGMPMAMPATTTKVCIAKGAEKNPPPSKDCEMSDIKVSGNKTSWRVRCNQNGEIMTGSGEMSGTPDKSEGTMHLSGKSGGQAFDMTMKHQSRRLGGSCDSEELANKMKDQSNKMKEQMCDTSKFKSTAEWLGSASILLNDQTCPGKKAPLCDAVRRDAVREAAVYRLLVVTEKNNGGLVTKACGLNMEATTGAVCKTLSRSNVDALAPYCPAEAKAYRVAARRKACEGRSYTSKADLGKCLGGDATGEVEDELVKPQAKSKTGTVKPDDADDDAQFKTRQSKPQSDSPNPAGAVLESAKKLKGLFGL